MVVSYIQILGTYAGLLALDEGLDLLTLRESSLSDHFKLMELSRVLNSWQAETDSKKTGISPLEKHVRVSEEDFETLRVARESV